MPKLNWNRIIIGGLIATVILFLTDGFFHEKVVGADWDAVYAALGAREPNESAGSMVYFAIFELGRGFISIFLYALMRQSFKPAVGQSGGISTHHFHRRHNRRRGDLQRQLDNQGDKNE